MQQHDFYMDDTLFKQSDVSILLFINCTLSLMNFDFKNQIRFSCIFFTNKNRLV